MVLTFGKHKGQQLEGVPTSYLRWALSDCEYVRSRPRLLYAFSAEFQRRSLGSPPEPAPVEPHDPVKLAYRELSMKYHPDKGGDARSMMVVNEFYELIRRKAH